MQLRAASAAVPSGGALFVYDLLATSVSIVLSLMLRFETIDLSVALHPYMPVAFLPLIIRPPVRLAFGLYRREWRFASTRELGDIVGSVVVGSMLILTLFGLASLFSIHGTDPFPRSFFIIEPLITLSLVGGIRFILRMHAERGLPRRMPDRSTRTLIYGAGEAGAGIARTAAGDRRLGIRVVGFLDDDPRKRGSRLLGHRVYGGLSEIAHIVERTGARQLLIAMPSRTGSVLRRAISAGQAVGLDVKTVPPIRDLITGEIQIARPRSISVEDLLRRPPVELDVDAIAAYLNGASVVVTGGGGSIGGELVRQILRVGPRVLTVLDYQEAALWAIERDAAALLRGNGVRLNPVLADVRSATAMTSVIGRAKPDVVFHAAALKHVPYVEMHPSEGVLTNVIGTHNVLQAAEQAGAPRFVLISTDKAVEPVSVMGRTKRLAEILTIGAAQRTGMAYSAVRFGNVLGSSGSLVPLIGRQLQDGLPVTITDPDATRYFMTLAEAVTLILQAGAAATARGIYVLDMGAPVRVGDLVADLVRLHGLEDTDIETHITGLRPGEKLHEKLYFRFEHPEPTSYAGISRAAGGPERLEWAISRDWLASLERSALSQDDTAIRGALVESMERIDAVPSPVARVSRS